MLMVRKKLVNSFFFYGTIYLGDHMKKKLLILFLFLSIFIVGGCKKKEEPKKEEVNEIRVLKEEEINTLMEKIEDLYYFDINPAKSFKTSELTNQEVLLWSIGLEDADGVLFSDLEKLALDYLDFSLEPENVLCMTHSNILGTSDYRYLYDVDTKKFVKNDNHAKHSESGYYAYVINKYVSSSYENGDYIITVSKIFSDTDRIINANSDSLVKRDWYKTYQDAKNKKNPVMSKSDYKKAEEFFNKNGAYKKYTYTFKLKNGNYVLKSYVIEE